MSKKPNKTPDTKNLPVEVQVALGLIPSKPEDSKEENSDGAE